MKKVDFLDLVCASLAQIGVGDAEIEIQRRNMENYLGSMGIGEESPMLDRENPADFADIICGNIAKKKNMPAQASKRAPMTVNEFSDDLPDIDAIEDTASEAEKYIGTEQAEAEAPIEVESYADEQIYSEDDDVKIFSGSAVNDDFLQSDSTAELPFDDEATEYSDPYYDEYYDDQTEYSDGSDYVENNNYVGPEYSGGTIEFDRSVSAEDDDIVPEGEVAEGEDYFEKNDDDEYIPAGNPVLFWVLVGLTAIFWLPLAILAVAAVAVAFLFMLAFEVLYIPGLIAVIVGGSAITVAELVYSIIKFVGKNPAVGMFELGLGIIVAALTFCLPTLMYFLGVSVFPKFIKSYWKNIGRLYRKLRRTYRKLKGACSI